MKFVLSFKTPDVTDQLEDLPEKEQQTAKEFAEKFLKYGEYIDVTFDTEAATATARKRS